jgi:CheY-like chemotaxis protein
MVNRDLESSHPGSADCTFALPGRGDLTAMATMTEVVSAEKVEAEISRRTEEAGSILVVDDSAVSRAQVSGLIRHGTGRKVFVAEGGQEALAILSRFQPAVVITDLQMPGMNGLELVEKIRAEYSRIPVILMTAFGSESIALQALMAGAASYVPKQSLAEQLVVTLKQVMEVVEGDQKRQSLLTRQVCSTCRFELENDPDLISPLIAKIQEELIAFGIGDATARTRVGVALQECLSNALYHGNLECSSDLRQEDERIFYDLAARRRWQEPFCRRQIHFESSIDRHSARFIIRDEGPGFDVAALDKPFDPEDLLRVGGRGMLLIRTFMDEVRHNATGNQVAMIKNK